MIYLLDFRTADTGGAVSPGILVTGPGLGTVHDLRAESQITVLTHGFNVSRPSGTATLLRLARLMPADGAYLCVLWPGDHFVRVISYPFEGNYADDTAAALSRYIGDTIGRGARISFVSHSLGARVVLETLKRLNQANYTAAQVCLQAAAIDDFSVADPSKYLSTMAKAERVAVLASRGDFVLSLAYPAGDLLQAFFFFRKDVPGLALGFHGPKPFKTTAVPRQVYHEQIGGMGVNHGDYFPDEPPTGKQHSAIAFATEVIDGVPQPRYH